MAYDEAPSAWQRVEIPLGFLTAPCLKIFPFLTVEKLKETLLRSIVDTKVQIYPLVSNSKWLQVRFAVL